MPPVVKNEEGETVETAPFDERVRWVEVFANSVQLHLTPLSIAPIFSRQRAGQAGEITR